MPRAKTRLSFSLFLQLNFIYSFSPPQDIESHRLQRGHVLAELLETERIYVNEMKSILTVGFTAFLFSAFVGMTSSRTCFVAKRRLFTDFEVN